MWISRRADAGLRAALALDPRGGVVASARDLAVRTGLPAPFLSQVLGRLRRGGVVESVAGRRGGYRLTRPADRISVGEVLRATGTSTAPIACAEDGPQGACDQRSSCRLRGVWLKVAAASAEVVDRIMLQELGGA